jgi:hypothetical protein
METEQIGTLIVRKGETAKDAPSARSANGRRGGVTVFRHNNPSVEAERSFLCR